MTSRERLLAVIRGEIPDHVPVAPDTSNMIPARLTGKPFWDLYMYRDPPIWLAYINCVKHFDYDSLMDGYATISFEDLGEIDHEWTEAIIYRDDGRIVTQKYRKALAKYEWADKINVYFRNDPPYMNMDPQKLGYPAAPDTYKDVEGVREWPHGEDLLKLAKAEMGEHGLVGVPSGVSMLLTKEDDICNYYEDPGPFYIMRENLLAYFEKRFHKLMSLECKPDFICTGGSGTLVYQTPEIFRELGLPIVKRIASLCKEAGIPSHIHSCGPEAELVKIVATETDLTIIDPLEVPPMGDCDLKEIKRLYGDRLVLKGNLHTTSVMLRGSVQDVIDASKRAIDDAAEGGRFILSTGDQCGRDTPDENIFAMIETGQTYGKY